MQQPLTKPTRYSWLIFTLSAVFLFYKYILQVSPAVMTNNLMHEYSLTATQLGFMVGFYFYSYMLLQIPSGMILDRYNPLKITAIVIFVCALGAYVFAKAESFYMACFARMLIGIGAAFATTSYMKLASQWFPLSYFPILAGLFGAACMSGAGTAEAPLAYLVNNAGWRGTMSICAYVGFALAIGFFILAKNKQVESNIQTQSFSLKRFLDVFKNKSNIPLLLYGGLSYTPATVFGGLWGVAYLMAAYDLPKPVAAKSVSLMFFGFALGSLAIGPIGKMVKRHVPIVIGGTVLSAACLYEVIYHPHLPMWALNSAIFMFGFCSGVYLLSYVIARKINSALIIATVIGVFNIGDPLFGAISDPLLGKILDLNWHGVIENGIRIYSVHAYHCALSVLFIFQLLAIVCLFFINERQYQESEALELQIDAST